MDVSACVILPARSVRESLSFYVLNVCCALNQNNTTQSYKHSEF
jgi:hypothetical protein